MIPIPHAASHLSTETSRKARFATRVERLAWCYGSPAATVYARSEAKPLERYASSSQYGLEVIIISDEKNLDRYFISKRPADAPRGTDNPRIFNDASPEPVNRSVSPLKKSPRTYVSVRKIIFDDPRYANPRIITGVRIARRKTQ